MSEWIQVGKGRRGSVSKAQNVERQSGCPVQTFLETFKTKECTEEEHHDFRRCKYWHNEKDRRRNPYLYCYTPDEAENAVERVYHPMLFRTQLCQRINCPFAEVCSFAHSNAALCSGMSEATYGAIFPSTKKQISVGMLDLTTSATLRTGPQSRTLSSSRSAQTNESIGAASPAWDRSVPLHASGRQQSCQLKLGLFERFLVTGSRWFRTHLETMCLEVLCTLKRSPSEPEVLQITGTNAHHVAQHIQQIVTDPPDFFVTKTERTFKSARVVPIIAKKLENEGAECFSANRQHTWVCTVAPNKVIIRTLRQGLEPSLADKADQIVLGQIDFWMDQVGYNKFSCCEVCGDDKCNSDEGVLCPEGHFVCCVDAENDCFSALVQSQVSELKSRDYLECPICKEPFDMQVVAKAVTRDTWKTLEEAIVESKVAIRAEDLRRDFDEKLQRKLQELINEHGNVESVIRLAARDLAQKARNDILNLQCPSCKAYYAEFDGCMALVCESCKCHFCACCHRIAANSRANHQHVRECDLNPTPSNSYYASPEQIKLAQRRYRIKKLKKFLRHQNKKDVQNATVVELQQDLHDLGIDPVALLSVDPEEVQAENE